MSDTLHWVVTQNSTDNDVRRNAELRFSERARQNPSQVCFDLVTCAADDKVPVDVRQLCLLHLRRMVPQFWSMGFSLFVGPPVDQGLKSAVREKVLALATGLPESRLRAGSAYVIVQIAAADYPDEWPTLLTDLYARAVVFSDETAVVGSLAVLNDLFDDLIAEDQFWDGGVGNQLISYITHMLGLQLSPEAKTSGLKLYLTVFNTLLSAEALELEDRRTSVLSHIVYLCELLLQLLKESSGADFGLLKLKSYIYRVFSQVLSNFARHVLPEIKKALLVTTAHDLFTSADVFTAVCVNEEKAVASLPAESITLHLADLFDTLSLLQHHVAISDALGGDFTSWVSSLVKCSVYPAESGDEYVANFNSYVTDTTGLSAHTSVRDSVHDFLTDLKDKDASAVFYTLKDDVFSANSWNIAEAHLFVLDGLFLNEDAQIARPDFSPAAFLNSLSALRAAPFPSPLVHAKIILLLPRFMEKFSALLSVNTLGTATMKKEIQDVSSLLGNEENQLVKASALVSATIWRNVPGFNLKLLGEETQKQIIELAYHLLEDSEEDTLPVLLEAISVAIDINHGSLLHVLVEQKYSVVEIIMLVSFKDPANIQLTIDSVECLQNILADLEPSQYLQICEKSVPYLLDVIKSNSGALVEYSPALFLALELLGSVIGAAPQSHTEEALPQELFLYAFPVLKNLILATSDDQILQNAGEVFNNFLQNGLKWFMQFSDPETGEKGMDILLRISSKFLAPELSDSAAMNCGLIVITLFEKFQSVLDQSFFYQLLQATVRRLVLAKEVITIENLIMVFCKLVLNTSPETLIDALTSMSIDGQNGLALVLPIWFSSFEVTRGFEKIKQNILALGKIFSLGDARVAELTVDGDPIPYLGDKIITRSIAKSMPQKYTQIQAPHKILKLLVSELEFQCLQPDPEDFKSGTVDNDEEDGWEDMGDIGVPTFDKLQSYVDSDEEEEQVLDEGIKDMVVQFFKECISKNLGGFQGYYEKLSDEEKTVISENVIFE